MKRGLFVLLIATSALTGRCWAAEMTADQAAPSDKLLQLALIPPKLQLVPEDQSIGGVRFNIYGRNQNTRGIDLGFVNETNAEFRGLGFGLINIVHGGAKGLQMGAVYNDTTGPSTGLQMGLVNRAKSMKGLQLGLVNFAEDMTGIQLGLFNQINNKEALPVLPLFNAAF